MMSVPVKGRSESTGDIRISDWSAVGGTSPSGLFRRTADELFLEEALFDYVDYAPRRVVVVVIDPVTGQVMTYLSSNRNDRFDDDTRARSSPSGSSWRAYENWINAVRWENGQNFTLQFPSLSIHSSLMPQHPSQLLETDPAPDLSNIVRQLERLRDLEDGWADGMQPADQWGEGYGKAPSPRGIEWLVDQFTVNYPVYALKPYIYPTPEGGVSLEWSLGPHRASLEIDLDTYQAEWHCLDLSTDESYEHDLQLGNPWSWEWLASEIRRLGTPAT